LGVIKQKVLTGDARACWVIFYHTVPYEIGFSGHKCKHISFNFSIFL